MEVSLSRKFSKAQHLMHQMCEAHRGKLGCSVVMLCSPGLKLFRPTLTKRYFDILLTKPKISLTYGEIRQVLSGPNYTSEMLVQTTYPKTLMPLLVSVFVTNIKSVMLCLHSLNAWSTSCSVSRNQLNGNTSLLELINSCCSRLKSSLRVLKLPAAFMKRTNARVNALKTRTSFAIA